MMQQWFLDAKLGIFIHWGIYAVNGISESWSIYNGEISYEDYMKQLDGFTASNYNPDEWADLFAKSGAKYAVLTTKHHDGVALFDTDLSDLNVANKTPAARDLVGPYCDAIRKARLKVGLYFSHLDWSNENYNTIYKDKTRKEQPTLSRFDYPEDEENREKWDEFVEFRDGQLTELMNRYSPDLLWFDGEWTRTAEQWKMKELKQMLLNMKDDVICNGRMCGYGDYSTPEQAVPIKVPNGPWEFCMTINDSWGYRPSDHNYKSLRSIIKTFCRCLCKGGNLLLDIGPKPDGSIDDKQKEILLQLGEWIGKNKEAVYGTVAGIAPDYFLGGSTLSKERDTLYLFVYDRPVDGITVHGIENNVKSVTLLNSNKPLSYTKGTSWAWAGVPNDLEIDLKESDLDRCVTVVKVELEGAIKLYTGFGRDDTIN